MDESRLFVVSCGQLVGRERAATVPQRGRPAVEAVEIDLDTPILPYPAVSAFLLDNR